MRPLFSVSGILLGAVVSAPSEQTAATKLPFGLDPITVRWERDVPCGKTTAPAI